MNRVCTKCGIEYPATAEYFYRDKSRKDGLKSHCKRCCAVYQQSEKGKAVIRRYQRTEKGKVTGRAAVKRYQQTEKGRVTNKRYYNTLKGYLCTVYHHIKQRCTNPKCRSYKDYGGRGIKCFFGSLDGFRNYVMNILQIDPRGLEIDRIDNDGHYEPGNIRFVTCKENNNNKGRRGELK